MHISMFLEEDQRPLLDRYNAEVKGASTNKIPLVQRNLNSGWPLLQVSMFSPTASDSRRYEHALGGGNCHFFDTAAFILSTMLSKIPGEMEIRGNFNASKSRGDLIVDNVGNFLEQFSVSHRSSGLTIKSISGAYGKSLTLEQSSFDPDSKAIKALTRKLTKAFKFALKSLDDEDAPPLIKDFGDYDGALSYSAEEIMGAINEDVAIFSNGQIFIDLGAFLDSVHDEDIKDLFSKLFHVEDFNALISDYIASKSSTVETSLPLEDPKSVSRAPVIHQDTKDTTRILKDKYHRIISEKGSSEPAPEPSAPKI